MKKSIKTYTYKLDFSKADASFIKDKIKKAELRVEKAKEIIEIWKGRLKRLKYDKV